MFTTEIHNFHQLLHTQVLGLVDPLKKANAGIEIANDSLSKLKEIVEQEDFENVPEEIDFFKHIKPCPMSYLIYFSEMRSCESRKPKAGASFQIRFFEKELRKINKFFYRNNDFVQYMEQGHSYMDHQLFTRNHRKNFPFTPMINYYQYPEFSSSHDMLWAKIQAMYRLIHYIREALEALKPGSVDILHPQKHPVLLWSGSKTALVELIYALYASQYLNHGLSDLSTVVASFEDFFNIKLDGIYKTYGEIKSRKGSRTKFLEELILKLEYKMRQDDV
ncbi:RteC domain-containing protein [Leeuwenhoekiella marinoflava]|uniref:RteC protein n=2 Tax=Leeuwenhoekiella marinoflava TaxID=988 RepID=A0A4Q0P673_9FLAO|nr:RteC domain-containing protein [Leeuwenhoekiella marinoflava]RXG21708.1 RteC protein [Leeuwenhoekiella marinoflava]SHF76337.1 RteC protein [Leeuwenhoekiella marinoflava DSM 3653]